nr:MAG TPA: hypothetical protein [Caudoviricetes sp.]
MLINYKTYYTYIITNCQVLFVNIFHTLLLLSIFFC